MVNHFGIQIICNGMVLATDSLHCRSGLCLKWLHRPVAAAWSLRMPILQHCLLQSMAMAVATVSWDGLSLKAVSEFVATAAATARFPCHHALKYSTSFATPLALVVAIAVAASVDTALHTGNLTLQMAHPRFNVSDDIRWTGSILWFLLIMSINCDELSKSWFYMWMIEMNLLFKKQRCVIPL